MEKCTLIMGLALKDNGRKGNKFQERWKSIITPMGLKMKPINGVPMFKEETYHKGLQGLETELITNINKESTFQNKS